MPIVITGQRFPYYKVILDDNPVGYWRLGETIGTDAFDSSGNGHDGTYVNTPTLGTAPLIRDTDKSVTLNGSDERIRITDRPAFDITGELTLEAWIKHDGTSISGAGAIVSKYSNSGDERSYHLIILPSGLPQFTISSDGTAPSTFFIPGSTNVDDTNTYHVAGVFTPSTSVKIYVNGELEGTNTTSIPASIYSGVADVFIGADLDLSSGRHFDGVIDEVAIYNKALTPERIKVHYNSGT